MDSKTKQKMQEYLDLGKVGAAVQVLIDGAGNTETKPDVADIEAERDQLELDLAREKADAAGVRYMPNWKTETILRKVEEAQKA